MAPSLFATECLLLVLLDLPMLLDLVCREVVFCNVAPTRVVQVQCPVQIPFTQSGRNKSCDHSRRHNCMTGRLQPASRAGSTYNSSTSSGATAVRTQAVTVYGDENVRSRSIRISLRCARPHAALTCGCASFFPPYVRHRTAYPGNQDHNLYIDRSLLGVANLRYREYLIVIGFNA